ncbi:hypothetical protein ACIP4Y_35685 [Streptomyces sp. NPDC088810]|uniref:hypothetical protein n=1 Tax=Streptomyces sp. NPDC088810 TaxID=3365904 RepID=UPI00382C5953
MTDEPAARGSAERLAAVCAHLEEIRRHLREGPGEGPVERLLDAARDGQDFAGPLMLLHAVLQAGGDPQGLDGYADTGSATRGVRSVGISVQPGERVYLCPDGRCARYWWPQSTGEVPRCAISGNALQPERL